MEVAGVPVWHSARHAVVQGGCTRQRSQHPFGSPQLLEALWARLGFMNAVIRSPATQPSTRLSLVTPASSLVHGPIHGCQSDGEHDWQFCLSRVLVNVFNKSDTYFGPKTETENLKP